MNSSKKRPPRGRRHTGASNKKGNRRGSGYGPKLTIINGCFSGLEIAVHKSTTLLGRDIDCDICLDHSFVSPQHATVTRDGDFYVLEDLNSRHGTSVGGKEIHRIRLKNGDLIGIGNFQIRFRQ